MSYKNELEIFIKNCKNLKLNVEENIEFKFEALYSKGNINKYESIMDWYQFLRESNSAEVQKIPLNECKGWRNTGDEIFHESGEFF